MPLFAVPSLALIKDRGRFIHVAKLSDLLCYDIVLFTGSVCNRSEVDDQFNTNTNNTNGAKYILVT